MTTNGAQIRNFLLLLHGDSILYLSITQQPPWSTLLENTKEILGGWKFEPGKSGREARMLLLCHAVLLAVFFSPEFLDSHVSLIGRFKSSGNIAMSFYLLVLRAQMNLVCLQGRLAATLWYTL